MMSRQPFTLLIHIALAIIVAGAIVTHYAGIQGELMLRDGAAPVRMFVKTSGPGDGTFPFEISLVDADIDFYPGTTTPMDFRSVLRIDGHDVNVSMNKVGEYDGWRFFQSGMSPDGSTLSVSHDPWGTGITYTGYILLGIGMIGFFFQRRTPWRALLRSRKGAVLLCLAMMPALCDAAELPAMQRPLASNLGKVYVYWNDRVCPMQTMARDVTLRLYGSDSYQGMTAEQVLSGWLFYYEEWLRDYEANAESVADATPKQRKAEAEKLGLINWLGTGEAFKIYPYRTAEGHLEWLSLTGKRPSRMELEQWKFMQTTMPDIKENLLAGHNIRANELLSGLIAGQRKYAGADTLPSETRIEAERLYNKWGRPLPAAIIVLLAGGFYLYAGISRRRIGRNIRMAMMAVTWLLLIYIGAILGVLWWISGHVPLSNGPEMMMFMALAALCGAVCLRSDILRGALSCIGAMTLFVAVMGGRTPRIGMLMPVLGSPLLSVHVAIVMISYVLFLLMAVLSAVALCSRKKENEAALSRMNRLILVPAVFLLGAGMFIGAVWANQSWGRYWGWDPKETCALVMFLIYSVPMHWASRPLKCFRKPRVLHWYLLLAVLSVLFTYFGANYLLPGLHSYA